MPNFSGDLPPQVSKLYDLAEELGYTWAARSRKMGYPVVEFPLKTEAESFAALAQEKGIPCKVGLCEHQILWGVRPQSP
jgi:hypothetical protein